MGDAAARQGAPVVSGVPCYLRPEPNRRGERIGLLLSFLELDPNEIEHARRDEAVEHRFLVGRKPDPRAFVSDFPGAHREEGFGLGPWNLGPLLVPRGPVASRGRENEKRVPRFDADEMIPVGPGREIALDDPVNDASFLPDETGQGSGDKKATLRHGTPLLSMEM